jgi:hypothetical protein
MMEYQRLEQQKRAIEKQQMMLEDGNLNQNSLFTQPISVDNRVLMNEVDRLKKDIQMIKYQEERRGQMDQYLRDNLQIPR